MTLPPGPRLPKAAQAVGYTLSFHRFTRSASKRYGPSWTLRLPGLAPAVMTTDREAIKRLMTGDPLRKRHANDVLRPTVGDGSLMLLEPAEHLARRKLVLPPFHGERIAAFRELVTELTEEELGGLSGRVEIRPAAQRLTLSVICQAVFGLRDRAEQRDIGELFEVLDNPAMSLGIFAPPLSRRARWNVFAEPVWRRHDRLLEILDRRIAHVRSGERTGDDILTMLAAEDLSDSDLRDELVTLIAAGHETTATAIAWAADALAHHPHVVEELREGDKDYLRATANEVLRRHTVVPVSAGRYPLDPFEIGEWTIPPGIAVLVHAAGIHEDPELYPDPDAFRPERFLDGTPRDYSFLPFGGGAHRCLGATLAVLELETAIDLLANRYEISPAGPPAQPVRRGVTLTPSGDAAVNLTARAA